ncbi:unnamed protein product [Allacma fusca]|uniref:Helicase ATP-binding domain-containing protein n=1 Tax=Allacma fusca TaxID=39272 RepID=A0A8J2PND0_9HEXA|nr:unnamed protein product [Allacma fusca]
MEQQNVDDDLNNSLHLGTSYPIEEVEDFLVDIAEIKDSLKLTSSLNYEGIEIQFPYGKAYPCQEHLMEEIIKALIARENCLLESPAGTGKTAALLCSALAWQQHEKANLELECSPPKKSKTSVNQNGESSQVPLIFYATRTLKHIDQIVDQLKHSSYTDTPMTILTSMVNSCKNEFNDYQCEDADSDEHFCQYNPENLKWCQHLRGQKDQTWKISDLKDFCEKSNKNNHFQTCPYFELLDAVKNARIIFCTYSYLLKANMREALDLHLNNNIIIFDEGHNVENVCYQISSTPEDFLTYTNMTNFTSILESDLNSSTVSVPLEKKEPLRVVVETLKSFRNFLLALSFRKFSNPVEISFQDFQNYFELTGFGPSNLSNLRKSYNVLTNRPYVFEVNGNRYKMGRHTSRFVGDLLGVLEFLWEGDTYNRNESEFKIFLTKSSSTVLPLDFGIRVMCMNPAVVFQQMNVAGSVIITSATLSPMKSFSTQLGIPFLHQLSEDHIVDTNRIFSKLIDKYDDNSFPPLELTSIYKENTKEWMSIQGQLGKIVADICHNVPKGVIVFVPSESYASKMLDAWKKNGSWKAIHAEKEIKHERKGMTSKEVKELLVEYRQSATTNKGAILFAYMRGKFSEGIDFKDDHSRALITIGIPFRPKQDLFVTNKMEYQNLKCKLKSTEKSDVLDGTQWWANDAFKALNQALGRNVRHKNDWGAIFMLDRRWNEMNKREMLPNWIRATLKNSGEKEEAGTWDKVLPNLSRYVGQFENDASSSAKP